VIKNRTKTAFGAASICVTLGILLCTLWPFNPFPQNRVMWLLNSNGVRITRNGLVLTAVPIVSDPGRPVTLELYLRPYETWGTYTILDFFQPHMPYQFRIRQYHGGLIISHQWRTEDGILKHRKVDLEGGLSHGVRALVTISSGRQGTAVYINGKWKETYPDFRFTTSDLDGRLAIGSAAVWPEPWEGELYGFAIYSKEFTSTDVQNGFDSWIGGSFSSDPQGLIARYRFTERSGNVIGNDVPAGTEMHIPNYFQVPQQAFLTLPWNEFEWSRSYVADVVRNIVGFMPFGLVCYAYLSWTRFASKAAGITILAGASLSFGIEILQGFLPQRVSGLTDVITNTLGTVLGVWLWRSLVSRNLFRNLYLQKEP